MNKVEKTDKKGRFIVEYMDGLCGTAFYDKSLAYVIKSINDCVPYREPKSIRWEEDKNQEESTMKYRYRDYGIKYHFYRKHNIFEISADGKSILFDTMDECKAYIDSLY